MRVLDMIEKELAAAKQGFERLQSTVIPAFHKTLAGKLPPIDEK